ncbi:TetR/AcrR family transcriptional regulator [Streptomyces nitrosporeus]|uniref:TetR/AcrR family transcriptional regulator n=1 Tax=Streptomyces nitrosporeus TaxID=28894 RepID=A0A5J6FDU9_9ACTN|nr:TetR/AcrR family transcriptional regulator [Streptomyces nitrosporeus]QEU73050.1 TetR/AcrR family transcriptional regulator [Streptomyces nitrosporeus]GGZ17675.1 TetR family transcriptional regulator [Streptomyces nitrosporeus]
MDVSVDQVTGTVDRARTRAREALLEAGLELFGVYGYAQTSEQALCEAAGVPEEVLWEEFGSREGILLTLHNQVTTKGLRAAEQALLSEGMDDCPVEQRFRRLFDAYVYAVTNDLREARVTFVEVLGVSHAVDEHCRRWRELWADFLTGEAERAAVRGEAEERDNRVVVMVMVASVHELMAHHSRRPRRARADEVSAELTRLGMEMMGIAPKDG